MPPRPLGAAFLVVASISVSACASPARTFNALAQDRSIKTPFGKFSIRRDNGGAMAYFKARF